MTIRRDWPLLVIVALAGWACWSWWTDGLMAVAIRSAADTDDGLETIRQFVLSTGAWAPVVYVAAVTVEVMIAPLPGALLYAPGGAIFGGLMGGTLALIGNVLGASLASWLAGTFGARFVAAGDHSTVGRLAARVRKRGLLVVVLLRINPLTSSDLVSYAAGLAGVPVWRVALGTAIGMTPLCYAQAYASEWIFRVLPGSGLVLLVLAAAYVVVIAWLLFRGTLSRT